MRRLIAFLALALGCMTPAFADAQVVLGVVNTGTPTYTTGESRPFQLNADGTLKVGAAAGAATGVAQASTTSGQSGVLTQCAATTAAPTYVTGTTNPINCTTSGEQRMQIGSVGLAAAVIASSSDSLPTSTVGLFTNSLQRVSDGAGNFVRLRAVGGSDGTGAGIGAANPVSCSVAACGLVSVRNVAVGSAQIIKGSGGNLYDWQVTSGASAGYVMIFNATTAPADGAVTPAQCVTVAANTTVGSSFNLVPEYYATGIVIVFSTTGCFTKTASATAFIRGRAQ